MTNQIAAYVLVLIATNFVDVPDFPAAQIGIYSRAECLVVEFGGQKFTNVLRRELVTDRVEFRSKPAEVRPDFQSNDPAKNPALIIPTLLSTFETIKAEPPPIVVPEGVNP